MVQYSTDLKDLPKSSGIYIIKNANKIINCMGAETIVFLDNIYWLGKTQTCVTWRAGVVDPSEWFINAYNPTPEELTLFELEFGKEVLDFVFSSNKKLEIMSL